MANEEHLTILGEGIYIWNEWRRDNPGISPDLAGAYLNDADLSGANLEDANLRGADLCGTDLRGADLQNANLRAFLNGSNLRRANLTGADLSWADLTGTNFAKGTLNGMVLSHSLMSSTSFIDVDLSQVKGLKEVVHQGPSTVGVDTIVNSKGQIPKEFLRGVGVPESFIEYIPSLIGAMQPIQFYSCFISYSTKDDGFARRLHSRLRDENLRVWFAPEDIMGGKKLMEQIDQAIRLHEKLLLVLSEPSMQSEWVETEIRKALKVASKGKGRKLFPIRLVDYEAIKAWKLRDPDTGKDLADEIREYYIPDFSNWKDHDAFEDAFGKLLRDLQASAEEETEV